DRDARRRALHVEGVRAAAALHGQARGPSVGDRGKTAYLHGGRGDGVGDVGGVAAIVDGEVAGVQAVEEEVSQPGHNREVVRAGTGVEGVGAAGGDSLHDVGAGGAAVEGDRPDIAVVDRDRVVERSQSGSDRVGVL